MKTRQRIFLIGAGIVIELASLAVVLFAFPFIFKLNVWQGEERVRPDEPLVIYFNQPILAFSLKDSLKIEPAIAGRVVVDDYGRRLMFLPTSYLPAGQRFQLSLGQVRSLSLSFSQKTDFSFYVAGVFGDKPLTTPLALPLVRRREPDGGCNPNGSQVLFGKYIDVDLTKKKIWLYEDGWCLAEYQVHKHGSSSMPTPRGKFKVLTKEKNHFSSSARVWMPWSMHFYGGAFLHGIPYFPDGRILQGAYSHGCIQIPTDQAEKIYQFAKIGIPVLVHD